MIRSSLKIPQLPKKLYPKPPDLSLDESVDLVSSFLQGGDGKTLVLTGAGVSVDSGIKAYRGKNGVYTTNKNHRPIFYNEFIQKESYRRRYWARSFLGYVPIRVAHPNPTHTALAALAKLGYVHHIITQNVDALHHRAISEEFFQYRIPTPENMETFDVAKYDSTPVLELHGTLRFALCLSCGHHVARDKLQKQLEELNPAWAEHVVAVREGLKTEKLNPDGDIELGPNVKYEEFNVPPCEKCGGSLKPKVTFFGESLEPHVRKISEHWMQTSSQVLVVGSSLATYSAFHLVKDAHSQGKKTGLINVGETRADELFDWRIGYEDGASAVLPAVAQKLKEKETDADVVAEVDALLSSGVYTKSIYEAPAG